MKTLIRNSAAVMAIAIVLAACSSESQPAPTVTVTETITATPTVEAESSPTETEASKEVEEERYVSHGTSPKGNLIKEVGDWAGISANADGEIMAVDFRITGITLDPECTAKYWDKPKNDQYVKIDLEVESYPELKEHGDFSLVNHDFTVFDSEGMRVNDPQGNGYTCLDTSDQLPVQIGPDEKVKGSIVLDVPKGVTALVYSNFLTDGGWEWAMTEVEAS